MEYLSWMLAVTVCLKVVSVQAVGRFRFPIFITSHL